jgi:GNAT superfamily N-acetyltransferase
MSTINFGGSVMKYRKYINGDTLGLYKQYYKSIDGGIDGYYEKTILDADIYEVYENHTIAYFSVYPNRGLTSLYVLDESQEVYNTIFEFVIDLPLFKNILFTENDKRFINAIKQYNIPYEIQAYNFISDINVVSSIRLKSVTSADYVAIQKEFGEFINYNNIKLERTQTFLYKIDEKLISFAAVEPLRLNDKRCCISMIVKEEYRRKGIGQETVKFLIEYLHTNDLEANARCYVLNEASKRTLLKSGMIISNYLYKINDKNQLH